MSRKELISVIKLRYLKAGKTEKGGILDEFCRSAGYARKYAILLLAAKTDNNRIAQIGRKQRPDKYCSEIIAAVVKI